MLMDTPQYQYVAYHSNEVDESNTTGSAVSTVSLAGLFKTLACLREASLECLRRFWFILLLRVQFLCDMLVEWRLDNGSAIVWIRHLSRIG